MELILASNNSKKKKELKEILNLYNVDLISLNEEDSIEVEETETTFLGNASLKALTIAKHFNKPALADDSGLCVDYLNGDPGIFSKRYSGLGDKENNIKLLKELTGVDNRKAHFNATICLAFPDGKVFSSIGLMHGKIAYLASGDEGFGYDPLFIPDEMNKTLAELGPEYKSIHSHRAIALKNLMEGFDEIINYWRYSWKR